MEDLVLEFLELVMVPSFLQNMISKMVDDEMARQNSYHLQWFSLFTGDAGGGEKYPKMDNRIGYVRRNHLTSN